MIIFRFLNKSACFSSLCLVTVRFGDMFLLLIAEHFNVKLHESLLFRFLSGAETLKPALFWQ